MTEPQAEAIALEADEPCVFGGRFADAGEQRGAFARTCFGVGVRAEPESEGPPGVGVENVSRDGRGRGRRLSIGTG